MSSKISTETSSVDPSSNKIPSNNNNKSQMNNNPTPLFTSPNTKETDDVIYNGNHQKTNYEVHKESLNSSMNNSSGLGDSFSLACCSAESSSSSSSVCGGSSTVNANYSSSDSIPTTPTSPINYQTNSSSITETLLSNSQKNNQKTISPINNQSKYSNSPDSEISIGTKNSQFGNFLSNQMSNLNLNQVDYDPFNDYMGMDKMMSNTDIKNSKNNFNLDPQQQQQIIAQALAAVASSTNANSVSGLTNNSESQSNTKSTTRSLTENIELLNSKFMSQKTLLAQNAPLENKSNLDKYTDLNNNSITSLLATVAAHNSQNLSQNVHNNDSQSSYNSNNLPINLKRQSYPLANQYQSNSQNLSSIRDLNTIISSNSNINAMSNHTPTQSGINGRLNSTPNLYNSNLSPEQLLQNNRSLQNNSNQYSSENKLANSMSTSNSNSSFNFNLNSSSNEIEMNLSRNQLNQINTSANNSSCYDDDDVFSTNTSFNSSCNNNKQNENNGSASHLDTVALAQLYRNFMSNSNSSSNNRHESQPNSNTNINELLSNYNANIAALSLNPDLINSASFLNSTNSMATQLKHLNQSNNNSNNLNSNTSGNGSNYSSARGNANLDQIAAVLKQRQNMMNTNRSSSGSMAGHPSSNIAALTSATSNIASLLNLNNSSSQHNQHAFLDSSLKRRISSNTFSGSSSCNSNNNTSNSSNSPYSNSSSLFSNNNVGPNASLLLQNSSLASSARLNSGTSSSAAASVLGSNSTLHALNSLQHQTGSSLNNSQNSHSNLINSNTSSGNVSTSNIGQHHQSNLLNFNMSPSPSSNHGILSALSLSSTAGNSLQNQLLSASGKPLRSERLPPHVVEEIIKQAKIRRRNGGKKEVCVFCRNNGEKEQIYTSHTLKDASNHVACPILRLYQCPICHATGDQAHTIKYCPYAEKDSNSIKLFKENGRMSAAAAFLMNSLAGNTSPSLSPPSTPPPSHIGNHSLMSQNLSLDMNMNSPSNHHNSLNAYLNSNISYNMGSAKMGITSPMLNSSSASNTAAANAANSVLTSRDTNNSLLSSNFSNQLNK